MTPEIRIEDFIDDLREIASSPGPRDEQFAAIKDLMDELESELTVWAEANDADMLALADCRGRVHERIAEEVNTDGASERFRDAFDYARGLLAAP